MELPAPITENVVSITITGDPAMVEDVYESLMDRWGPASTLTVEEVEFTEPTLVTWGTYIKKVDGSH